MEARVEAYAAGAAVEKAIDVEGGATSVMYIALDRASRSNCQHFRIIDGPSGKILILWPDTKRAERIPLTGT